MDKALCDGGRGRGRGKEGGGGEKGLRAEGLRAEDDNDEDALRASKSSPFGEDGAAAAAEAALVT